MTDARFEEGREAPLNLGAEDAEDIGILSALVQDAVFGATDIQWDQAGRRVSLLLNRFRWEDRGAGRHAPERVRSVLVIENAMAVASQGVDRRDEGLVLSLLSVSFELDEQAPGGDVLLTLAGDGAIRVTVEAPELRLRDVTRPYRAPSGRRPSHD
ncbi:hypothetical protein OB2597_05900 [Pseudooceanicola batsensis HTCC2597]|uniref:DUF2948 domain-containing protein n=1 Tax=Pseudooceanicola batsensis (strain ATCC BAA-863 / DSM 15984 / KCTC 12145 / HTCC2597) TaxID=252305 RepID=A3TT15_PSEBH|nr:DUF2948 family protein [Pseudooceanicola batsensis]EAQ04792.1 hypothetical protein OB2597_05900 [Pseudooceanicola batsensis HTCC2597]